MHSLALVLVAAGLLASAARSQGEADNEPLKNVKIFTGKTRKEVTTIMKTFTQGLGVKCSFCHVKDYSSDEKAEKKTAREMIKMLDEMNAKYSMLEKKGSCFMCHRGNKEVAFQP
jgi:hypothetical protein